MVGKGNVDKERYRSSLARLDAIYRGISASAVSVSAWRCPYKSAQDRCTAGFGCRNQRFDQGQDRPALCVGSDDLDYRSAWETAAP